MTFSLSQIPFLKNLLKKRRPLSFSPQRDWRIILLGGMTLFIVLVAWNVVMFVGVVFFVGNEKEEVSGTDATEALIERASALEASFELRKATYESILTSPYPFVDPSQ